MSGAPPFRAKGRGFTSTLRYASKRVPGGVEALHRRLDPADRAYIGQLFIESGWYDAFVLERVMRAVAELQDQSLRDFARDSAIQTAHRDLSGAYRHSFRAGSAGEMAARLPRGFNRYFEPMHAVVLGVEPTTATYELRRVPERLRELAEGVTEGFCTGAMGLAGVPPPLFSWDPPVPGEREGRTPTMTLPFRLFW